MFKHIVKITVLRIFRELNKANYEPVLAGFAASYEHWFVGESALSGLRTDAVTTRLWYERLYMIFPNIQFDISSVAISGPPWNTLVAVEWADSYTLRNGERRDNCGVHLIRLKWGRGTSVRIYCDTQRLNENLAIQAAGGITAASAAPLISSILPHRQQQ